MEDLKLQTVCAGEKLLRFYQFTILCFMGLIIGQCVLTNPNVLQQHWKLWNQDISAGVASGFNTCLELHSEGTFEPALQRHGEMMEFTTEREVYGEKSGICCGLVSPVFTLFFFPVFGYSFRGHRPSQSCRVSQELGWLVKYTT